MYLIKLPARQINLLPPHRVGGHRVKVPVQLNGISVDLRFVAVGAAAKDGKGSLPGGI